jgi:hypothetical protein
MTGMFGVAMCLRERHFGDPTCCTWISQGSPRSETELRQYCHNAAKTLANVLVDDKTRNFKGLEIRVMHHQKYSGWIVLGVSCLVLLHSSSNGPMFVD